MTEFDDAIFARLNGSTILQDRMADNTVAPDNVPFYIDVPRIPSDQDTPYGFVSGPVRNETDSDSSSKTKTGIDQNRAIRIYDNVQQSHERIGKIGQAISNLFHDELLDIEGWSTVFTTADRPTVAPTEIDDLRGRIININLTTTRSEK